MTNEGEIGGGSYGTVYEVCQEGRKYALKHISIPRTFAKASDPAPEGGGLPQDSCRQAAEEILNEVRILLRFKNHPNIVSIRDYRMIESGQGIDLYILMERLVPLPDYESRHAIGEEEAIRLGLDLCSALEACASEGILHRDLKPANILVAEDGTFKICDFGTARILEKTLMASTVKGSFAYMAPEVYHGKRYDCRADIYSIGLILYRLMNRGREPFLPLDLCLVDYRAREDALNRRMNGEALPAAQDASEGFMDILLKACAYYPIKRYASAAAMKKDLLRLQAGTYQVKAARSEKYGKRGRRFYIRAALIALLALGMACAAGAGAFRFYEDRYADYCDSDIKKKLQEEYGITSGARLNGKGVLYIEKQEDLACTANSEYPWMHQKNRIQKIVFGEDVTFYQPNYYGIDMSEGIVIDESSDSGMIRVSEESFRSCQNLAEIVINSSSFSFYSQYGFQGAEKLESIRCPEDADIIFYYPEFQDTPWFNAPGCRLLGTTLVRYNGTQEILDDIPVQTTRIARSAFSYNETLKEIILPCQVTEIESLAFYECSHLASITLPESLTTIGDFAFRGCSSLDHLILPAGVAAIGASAFTGCRSLSDLVLLPGNPAYVLLDGILYDSAKTQLLWCSPGYDGILEIPEGVFTASESLLAACDSLRGVVIPDSFSLSSGDLFGPCPALEEITVSDTHPSLALEDGILYSRDKSSLYLCPRNKTGSLIVPDGVRAIRAFAFASCTGLTEIILPETAGYYMTGAFEGCTALQSLTLPSAVSYIGNNALSGCDSLKGLYYMGSREAWERMTSRFDIGLDEERTTVHAKEG